MTNAELVTSHEKGIFRNPSKKMWAGIAGFLALSCVFFGALLLNAHPWAQAILAFGLTMIPPSLIWGLAWMDGIVRTAHAVRGLPSPGFHHRGSGLQPPVIPDDK